MTSRKLQALTAAAALLVATSVPGLAAQRKSVRTHEHANVTIYEPHRNGYDAYARQPASGERTYDQRGGDASHEWPGQW